MLVVDDEPMVLECINRILRVEFDVVLSSSPTEALARVLGGEQYDAILCDMMMPRVSGLDVHATLARYCPDQAARMALVTGGATQAAEAAFLEHTSLPCLLKPFTVDMLREIVRRVIGSARDEGDSLHPVPELVARVLTRR